MKLSDILIKRRVDTYGLKPGVGQPTGRPQIPDVELEVIPGSMGIPVAKAIHPEEEMLREALLKVAQIFDFATDGEWASFEREVMYEAFKKFRALLESATDAPGRILAQKRAFSHAYEILLGIAQGIERGRDNRDHRYGAPRVTR